jgi:hypothetical protein
MANTNLMTSAEYATYQTLLAAQQTPGNATNASSEALRAFMSGVGQRLFNAQAAAWAAGTLGTSGIQNPGV